ncbi:MAG: transglycosylase SLT domain-containing protein [Ignavibacteriaceae bacterium]|nr:transglycosylase SLT domain-containing protein [Ignavibacteriaceae bacterium]
MTVYQKVKSFEPLIRKYITVYFEILTPAEKEDLVRRYMSQIWQESQGNNAAIGDGGKSYGLGQIYFPTFNEINAKYFNSKYKHADILGSTAAAAELNIHFGILVLKEKYKSYAASLPEWPARLDMMTRRYNGSGSKAESYLQKVKKINREQFPPDGGLHPVTAPIVAGGSMLSVFLIAGLAVSFFLGVNG